MSRATFSGLLLAAMSGLGCGACQVDAAAPGAAGFGAAPTAGVGAAGQGGSPTGGQAGTGAGTDAGAGADAAGHDASAITDRRCPADPSIPQRTDFSKAGPLTAATMDVTFEDKSRRLPATANQPGAPSRTLVTTIYYPSSGPAPFLVGPSPLATGGPFPMLMYSHGYSSNRGEASRAAKRLASYGYIVVAPDFPLSNIGANGGPVLVDAANQPGDLSFLIDQLLRFSHDSQHVLSGGVDEARIGVLGVSLGGLTTLLVTFHPRFQDKRVKVAMPIAPVSKVLAKGFYHTRQVPMLLVAGDLDAFLEYSKNARRSFEFAAPNAMLVTIAKGTHAAFGFDFGPGLIPLLNALIAPAGADPSNTDGLGCGAVGKTLQMVGPEWVTALGGANDFIDASESNLEVCARDEYKHAAIDAQEQEDILLRAAVPFFDAHLGSTPELRQDGCRYLIYELPKHPSVALE
jgi:dienelactone hydrolase